MKLITQKKLASDVLKISKEKVWLDVTRLEEIKEAITKADIRSLIKDKAIKGKKIVGTSRSRARKIQVQKLKGRRRGDGSRKSATNARIKKKRVWINHIRTQREFLKNLRGKEVIDKTVYRSLFLKSKGGFFRSKRHLKLYMEDHGLLKK